MNKREYHLKRKFGITNEQYEKLLRQQEFRCGVCGRHHLEFRKKLAVDHDHQSGLIRGLLCFKCNKFVVGRHTRISIQSLIKYLDKEYTGWIVPPKVKRKKKCRKKRKRRLRGS